MTLIDSLPNTVPVSDHAQRTRIFPVLTAALLSILIISLPNLLDPIIRHDDYPAYFGDAATFWEKTLHEGRWLNYVWHLRGIETPAWLNFSVYQALWALFAAATAMAALGKKGPGWFSVVLALLILVAPPASLISLWFNTLIPGLAIVSLYAVLGCYLPPTKLRMLLPVFVVVSFMAYSTYPLLLLAIVLVRSDERSLKDLASILVLFIFSFALAVLTAYSLNWQIHGIFGVPLAEWRDGNPATDFDGLLANLPRVTQSVSDFLVKTAFEFKPAVVFHIGMLMAASIVLWRNARLEALYLHAGLWMGLGLMTVQISKLGVIAPPRAFIFVWVFYALLIVRASEILTQKGGLSGRMARNFVLLILGSYLLQTFTQYSTYRPWQQETRRLATIVASAQEPIYLQGQVLQLPSAKAAFIQTETALISRMRQLTGRDTILCHTDLAACEQAKLGGGTVIDLE
ncbi:hypothetical protein ACN2XU_11465 [Primorskyibacter sp. 2E107]|uniref:hypothetical protein n=1 Tax=Primorskyibacter sp. 2E107 TaxID=3403458 RepID=UPI003AF6AED3